MKNQTYKTASGILFSIVSLSHFVRAIKMWELTIGGVIIPQSVSWVAVLVTGYLAYWAFHINKK